jgi:carboxypeptidase C (cathepsin A)
MNASIACFCANVSSLVSFLSIIIGHMVPKDQPAVALDMLKQFLQGTPF